MTDARTIADQQGWTEETLLDLALRFIEERHMDAEFFEYLYDAAALADEPDDEVK